MDYLITCSCAHTLEDHTSDGGCTRCECSRNRVGALEAFIAAIRVESWRSGRDGATLTLPPGK